MASATGIPDVNNLRGTGEDEPLLGRRGDASQQDGTSLLWNLYLGTAAVAQAGIWVLAAIVWGSIFSHDLIFMSAHPLLNSAGLLLVVQAALVLQPTHTPEQKRAGTIAHAIFHFFGVSALTSGLVIIEINKARSGHRAEFASAHARLGLIFYILIYAQVFVGFTQYWVQSIYGGEEKAKKIWKYHRVGGYITATLGLATVCAATWTTYVVNVLSTQKWAVILASVITLVGVVPRIKLQKLGLRRDGENSEGRIRLDL
ncbi:hypothetical protein BDV96DRAFT_493381 [Lophiotrema nucula]|uniref:Cytochrome b561 domain-containing protein n=1 Tax=Lophiotrema nucula TaxID=690887 RepID=A0A6A5Z816_9PLEO|nr:hypothetical protein BDV96DRAFT_493381 [Lophiotrema nucula]